MGNQIACCRQKWSPLDESPEQVSADAVENSKFGYQNAGAIFHSDTWLPREICDETYTSGSLSSVHPGVTQHISEREPDDVEFDPSLNASQCALFMTASSVPIRSSTSVSSTSKVSRIDYCTQKPPNFSSEPGSLRRWSSCSTVYIGDGYLVNPHQETTLWSVAIAIELISKSPKNNDLFCALASERNSCVSDQLSTQLDIVQLYDEVYQLYDERIYSIGQCYTDSSLIIPKPDFQNYPQARDVHGFLRGLFSTALLSPQCAIVALIFLERLINAAEVGLMPWSWRRQLLSCLILASKLLDDQAVWNTDYCQVLRDLSLDDLNALERHTLSLLQFNVDITPAVYARYYFDLLTVGQAHGVTNHLSERKRLTPELARHLRILPSRPESRSQQSATIDTRLLFDLARTDEPLPPRCTAPKKPEMNIAAKAPVTFIQPQQVSVNTLDVKPLPVNHRSQDSRVHISIQPESSNAFDHFRSPDWAPDIPSDPLTDNEPLILDDEAEFINSLTLSTVLQSTSPVPVESNAVICDSISRRDPLINNPPYIPAVQINPTSNSRVASFHPGRTVNSQCGVESHFSGITMQNPVGNNGTGFIRSIMGGEVAYSLLRDAGMY